jgi:hypothetical protein
MQRELLRYKSEFNNSALSAQATAKAINAIMKARMEPKLFTIRDQAFFGTV